MKVKQTNWRVKLFTYFFLIVNNLVKLALHHGMKITNILLFLIIQTISINFLFAQKYNFTSYTVADGLPNNQINDIFHVFFVYHFDGGMHVFKR